MQVEVFKVKRYADLERKSGKTVGLCHGCFDIIHHGHIAHFKIAKEKCDILFVSVTADDFVNKGPGRPYNCLSDRLTVLDAIKYVNYVFESNYSDAIWSINQVAPKYFFKGSDYVRGSAYNLNFNREKNYANELGIKTIFTNGETSSSTILYDRLKSDCRVTHQL